MIIFFYKLRTSLRGFIWKGLKCNKARDESERKRFMRGCLRRRVAQWEAATWKSYPSFPLSLSATLSLLFLSSSRAIYVLFSFFTRVTCKKKQRKKKFKQQKLARPSSPILFTSTRPQPLLPFSSSSVIILQPSSPPRARHREEERDRRGPPGRRSKGRSPGRGRGSSGWMVFRWFGEKFHLLGLNCKLGFIAQIFGGFWSELKSVELMSFIWLLDLINDVPSSDLCIWVDFEWFEDFELAVNSLCKLTWSVRYRFNLDLLIFFLDNRRYEVSKMTKNV